MVDTGYVRDPNDVVLQPGVVEGLKEAKAMGFELVVVSNQSGLARGIIRPEAFQAVQSRLEALLAEGGVVLDDARFCPHGPDDGCACRKPKPGMLLDAARDRGIDLAHSVMVGDSARDVAAGIAAGCRTILLGKAPSDPAPDHVVESFSQIPPLLRSFLG